MTAVSDGIHFDSRCSSVWVKYREIMDFGSESDSTDDIYEVERILDAKRKVSQAISEVRYVN